MATACLLSWLHRLSLAAAKLHTLNHIARVWSGTAQHDCMKALARKVHEGNGGTQNQRRDETPGAASLPCSAWYS